MLDPVATPRAATGLTLIETLITVAILGIVVALGVPAMTEMLEKNHLATTTEAVASELQNARWEAIKRNQDLFVAFATDGAYVWCYGVDEADGCDCWAADSCTLTVAGAEVLNTTTSTRYPNARLTWANFGGTTSTRFDSVRGTASAGGVAFESRGGLELRVRISSLGRIGVCTPGGAGQVSGYRTC